MKKALFALLFLVASCSTDSYFSSDTTDIYEEDLSQGKVIDYNAQSLYEVTSSDSLASIARKYGTTSDNLILMNNLRSPYILKPGMLIKVPTVKTVDKSGQVSGRGIESEESEKIIQIKPSSKK